MPERNVEAFLLPVLMLLLISMNGSIAYFHMLPKTVPFIIATVLGVLLAGALFLREHAFAHAVLLTFLVAVWNLVADIAIWPFLIVPLIVYALTAFSVPSLRRSVRWLAVGRFDKPVWLLMISTVFVSSVALLAWFKAWHPDLTHYLKSIPSWHPAALVFEGIGFSLLNAAMEESMYRGVLMQALDTALGPGISSIIYQAAAFGLLHIKGIPGDWIGVGMTCIYGLMLGVIRRRSGGILAPFATHVFADVTIFIILVTLVR